MSAAAVLERGTEPYPGYRLYQLLGRGAFGQVWEAETDHGTNVALKFLSCDRKAKASLESQSIQMVRQLKHPNLIRIDNVWCCPGYLVVAMELADGSLLDLYDAYQAEFGTPIDADHLCLLLAQAAAALDFLNSRRHHINDQLVGIQHCDVNPSNILVLGEKVKISDFSLASATASLMKSHRRAGTMAYTAPEVFQGRLSERTDQYALAVTYCLLRGGRLPFPDVPETFSRQYVWPIPDLTMLPEAERPAIARALSLKPTDRWSTCGELVSQLQKASRRKPDAELPPKNAGSDVKSPPKPSNGNRRCSVRHPCGLSTSWRLLGEDENKFWSASIQDISNKGIGMLSDASFERGTILVVNLREPSETPSRLVYVRVARSVKQPGGQWLLGCTFVRQLANQELQALLHFSQLKPTASL